MIVRETIDNRSASVQYLSRDHKPVDDLEKAFWLNIIFDDGGMAMALGPASLQTTATDKKE